MSKAQDDIQKHIDNGNIDTDPICKTELFGKLKWAIGGFMFQHLRMNESEISIEANPASHQIAKYVYNLLKPEGLPSTPLQPVKDEGAMAWLKREGYPDVMPMTLDNLGIILDRYTKYLSSPPEPASKEQPNFLSVLEENYEAAKRMQIGIEDGENFSAGEKSILIETYEDLISIYKNRFSKEQEDDAVGFGDWIDEKQMSRQLCRLKDNRAKWFYNHKPEAKEGKQQWEHYTTEQLYQLYKKKPSGKQYLGEQWDELKNKNL